MKVLLPIATSQGLMVMPRANVATVDLTLRKAGTDTTTVYGDITTSFSDGYLTIPFSHGFSEGETYEATVTRSDNDGLLWRGQVFITAQTPQNYKQYA